MSDFKHIAVGFKSDHLARLIHLEFDQGWEVPMDLNNHPERRRNLYALTRNLLDAYEDYLESAQGLDDLADPEDPIRYVLHHLESFVKANYPDDVPLAYYPMDLNGMVLVVLIRKTA